MGKNTSRNFLLDYLIMIKQMKKDNKSVQENLKKLELHETLKRYQKVFLINSSSNDLKTADGVLDI